MTQRLKAQQDPTLIRMDTLGDGSCAFHAILGEWANQRGQYVCESAVQKRAQVAEFILASDPNSRVRGLVFSAMQQLVLEIADNPIGFTSMRRRFSKELSIKDIAEAYKNWRASCNRETSQIKKNIIDKIKRNPELMNKISSKLNPEDIQKQNNDDGMIFVNFRAQVNDEEYKKIAPELVADSEAYSKISNEEFNWDLLKEPSVLEDYLDSVIRNPSAFLLVTELGIVAYAFNLQIQCQFFNKDGNPCGELTVYNKEASEVINVALIEEKRHFERMLPAKDAELVKQSQHYEEVRKINQLDSFNGLDPQAKQQVVCSLCNSFLHWPIVKPMIISNGAAGKVLISDEQPLEGPFFHESCLKKHIEETVADPDADPNSFIKSMKVRYQSVDSKEIPDDMRGSLPVINPENFQPVKAANGKIYDRQALIAYMDKAPRVLSDGTLILKGYSPVDDATFQQICKVASEHGIKINDQKQSINEILKAQEAKECWDTMKLIRGVFDVFKSEIPSANEIENPSPVEMDININRFGRITYGIRNKTLEGWKGKYWFIADEVALDNVFFVYFKIFIFYGILGAGLSGAIIWALNIQNLVHIIYLSSVVSILAMGLGFGAQYKAREFRGSLQQSMQDFLVGNNRELYQKIESSLGAQLGEGEEGVSSVNLLLRTLHLSPDEHGFAYLLRGSNAIFLKERNWQRNAYHYFQEAFNEAQDEQIRGMALFGQIQLLQADDHALITHEDFNERQSELDRKLNLLNKEFKAVPKQLIDFLMHHLSGLQEQNSNDFLKHFFENDLKKFLVIQDLHLIRDFEPYGKLLEAVVPFIQGQLAVLIGLADTNLTDAGKERIRLIYQNKGFKFSSDSPFISASFDVARKSFLESWRMLKKAYFDTQKNRFNDPQIEKIAQDMQSYILNFWKRCVRLGYFTDERAFLNGMISAQLCRSIDESLLLSPQELIERVSQSPQQTIPESILTRVLNEIITNPSFARHHFSNHQTWMPYLVKEIDKPKLTDLVGQAIIKVFEVHRMARADLPATAPHGCSASLFAASSNASSQASAVPEEDRKTNHSRTF